METITTTVLLHWAKNKNNKKEKRKQKLKNIFRNYNEHIIKQRKLNTNIIQLEWDKHI